MKQNEEEVKRKFLAYFILFWPTVIIAVVPDSIGVYVAMGIKTLLAFYQFVVIKNFVDTHYGE